ncbi:putative transporter [Vibrio nigripulchritudo SOn1]|uniref:Transporter n=1 Tax=Vibrio nigripulchritudo SOn1 TaxID=1238450 RepID=A0AAV2VNE6_9VIBR|nr:arsenic resistance protein [Vibrio nigripulchritudo]CCO46204.1 putative transporter [Vibrio nigripulchritudo SOn1]
MFKKHVTKTISLFTHSTSLLVLAIVVGSIIGLTSPSLGSSAGNYIDPTIMALVVLLLFEVPLKGVFKGGTNVRFIGLAWVMNFIIIPVVGFGIASVFLSGEALFYTGLVIYFMAPCTDWYLGFTRLAKGNVELGATLLPINMVSQLVLFPVYLLAFNTVIEYKIDLTVLLEWFIKPLIAATVLRFVLHRFIDKLLPICNALIPLVLMLLVGQIFAANINQLAAHLSIVPLLLLAIFVFFIVTFALGELAAKFAKLEYLEHCLLTFTTGARNAPLMLGLTTVAIPDQPLIYATITIGMLIEFPHLTALKAIFLKRFKSESSSNLATSS